ncbi:hypothetical protein ACGGAQ_03265 [Micromonospora sp. NPDC047557]|uniref:hypothetical protein n=1 Tax=Micromonospora sp. NPDC047557 TaxID=3364250 RepID=UPI003717C8AF
MSVRVAVHLKLDPKLLGSADRNTDSNPNRAGHGADVPWSQRHAALHPERGWVADDHTAGDDSEQENDDRQADDEQQICGLIMRGHQVG